MKRITTIVLLAVAGLWFCPTAPAFAQPTSPQENIWQFEFTPYLWAAGLEGDARVGTRLPDASFSDLSKSLDMGFMGLFEARKDRWGLLADVFYVKLSKTSDPLLGGQLGTAEYDTTEQIYQFAAAYRVAESRTTPVDLIGGLRYANLKQGLTLSSSPLLPTGANRSLTKDWTDGFVGVRAQHALSDYWSLVGYADVGGGGTKQSWQLLAGVNYEFSKTLTGKFGYRMSA